MFLDYRTKTKKKEYRSSTKQCKGCALATSCLGKSAKEKKFSVTYYRAEYERNNKRVKSQRGRLLKKKRSSTIEPVFGVLTQYFGLRKINTRGLDQANKVMLLSATAYNLKKYLNYPMNKVKTKAKAIRNQFCLKTAFSGLYRTIFKALIFDFNY